MKRWAVIFLSLLMVFSLVACGGQKNEGAQTADVPAWQEQYDLGLKFLSEGNYEEAIIAFTAVIEIDPKNTDAYLGLADAYLGSGDTERAAQVLSDALLLAADPEALQAKLNEVAAQGAVPQPLEGYPKTERHDADDGSYDVVEYNEFGNQLSWTWYDASGAAYAAYIYDYDAVQRLIALHFYRYDDAIGGSPHYNVRYYGADGREYEMYAEWEDGHVCKKRYIYTPGNTEVSVELEDSMHYSQTLRLTYTMQAAENQIDLHGWGGSVVNILEKTPEGETVRDAGYNHDGTVYTGD